MWSAMPCQEWQWLCTALFHRGRDLWFREASLHSVLLQTSVHSLLLYPSISTPRQLIKHSFGIACEGGVLVGRCILCLRGLKEGKRDWFLVHAHRSLRAISAAGDSGQHHVMFLYWISSNQIADWEHHMEPHRATNCVDCALFLQPATRVDCTPS